jgi:2,3-bisphosphoglycerate-dependent phosphoglycerate mutase
MKKLTLALLAILFTVAVHAAPVTTVILVRHAEKAAAPADDPPLTEEGTARAERLARMLASSGVTTIYTTPFMRTRGTAAPLATALKLKPLEVKTGPAYAAEVARLIREKHAGGTVLVVGHSNSTQNVMKALGVTSAPKIEETEFDNLFVVTLTEGAEPRMLVLKY